MTLLRRVALAVGLALLSVLVIMTASAPEFLSSPDQEHFYAGPGAGFPFGADAMGISLVEYAFQGASIVTIPAVLSGVLVAILAALSGVSAASGGGGGHVRRAGAEVVREVRDLGTPEGGPLQFVGALFRLDLALVAQGWTWFLPAFSELVGSLPRLVVILVVALALPLDWRGLLPIGVTWALLASPGAMDEAAATAERLGGSRFVEALRAHGFSVFRIYGIHIIWKNLRAVIVRQAAEIAMQVVFLEIALSYLATSRSQPSFTHADSVHSWASLLYYGYTYLVAGVPMLHALLLGMVLVAMVAVMAQSIRASAGSN